MFTALPKTDEARVPGKQVLRSGTSVGANCREAHRSRSKAEFISKLGDCLKELDETAFWLELLPESGMGPRTQARPTQDECRQLLAIFTTISKNATANPS